MISFGNQFASKIYDTVWGLASDAILAQIKDATEQKKMKEKLEKYLSKELDKNLHVSREEEIDFEGLANYIRGNLLEDIEICLFGQTEERRYARENILEKAVAYASANTKLSRKRAQNMVSDVVEILKRFRYSRVSKDLRGLSGEIIDDVNDNTNEQVQKIHDKINNLTDEMKNIITTNATMSIDRNAELLKNGKISEVENNFNMSLNGLARQHILPDFFKYELKNINNTYRLVSVPIHPDACKLYPPKIKGFSDFKIEGVDKNLWKYDIIDYAYRHQLKITMTVQNAEKYLGEVKDQSQVEAQIMEGQNYTIYPKPFPPAFPCSIIGNDKTIVDYLLLRTKEISDDGIYTITNDEQNERQFKFTLNINTKNKTVDFNFSAVGFGNRGQLEILKIKKGLTPCTEFKIHLLGQNTDLLCGNFGASNCSRIRSIEEDISIFERVLNVEEYFKTELDVPSQVSAQEIEYLKYISELICGGTCEFDWNQLVCNLDIDEEIKKTFLSSPGKEYTIQRDGTIGIDLWGSKFKLPIRRVYVCAKILNYKRIKEKLQVLDIGDSLKVTFVPGSGGNSVEDRLRSS